jgi:hypothetical protein
VSELVFARIREQLLPLQATPFELEQDLQRLVADHPELLAVAQMNPSVPRRFVLIDTEVATPDEAEGVGPRGTGSSLR